MRFDRPAVLAHLEELGLSPAEQKRLADRFFPELSRPLAPIRTLLRDQKRWARYLDDEEADPSSPFSYEITHEHLVRRAVQVPPKNLGNTVTAFAGWVFSLYQSRRSEEALRRGRRGERAIARQMGAVPSKKGWDLIFQDPLTDDREPKQISALRVNNRPIWGVPDLVFKERATGRLVIVERKVTNATVPSDGWPNLRAQLWAYSKIDEWCQAPDITLVGEIWGFTTDKYLLKGTLRWKATNGRFQHENAELFSLYGDT